MQLHTVNYMKLSDFKKEFKEQFPHISFDEVMDSCPWSFGDSTMTLVTTGEMVYHFVTYLDKAPLDFLISMVNWLLSSGCAAYIDLEN